MVHVNSSEKTTHPLHEQDGSHPTGCQREGEETEEGVGTEEEEKSLNLDEDDDQEPTDLKEIDKT